MFDLNTKLPERSTTRTLKRLIPFLKAQNIETVLDYGAGTLRNTNYLLKNGFKVSIVDKSEQLVKIANMPEMRFIDKVLSEEEIGFSNIIVDAVVSNFVLSLLDIKEQNIMVNYMCNIIKNNGYLLIEIKKNINNLNVNEGEQQSHLDNLIVPFGFDRIISLRNKHSISSLYQKTNLNWN